MDVPAAEAQSRYVQMTPEENSVIARAYNDGASGILDPAVAKEVILAVWSDSCERRKAEAETKEILPDPVMAPAVEPVVAEAATDVTDVENTGIEVAKELDEQPTSRSKKHRKTAE